MRQVVCRRLPNWSVMIQNHSRSSRSVSIWPKDYADLRSARRSAERRVWTRRPPNHDLPSGGNEIVAFSVIAAGKGARKINSPMVAWTVCKRKPQVGGGANLPGVEGPRLGSA